jgi:hypothetical protein
MGRPERDLDTTDPLHAFAAELRLLRERVGLPKYLAMARRSGVSRTALAEAAGGDHLPSWRTVEAYVRACGADPEEWLPRWERLRDHIAAGSRSNGKTAPAVGERPPPGRPRWSLIAAGAGLVVLTAIVVGIAGRLAAARPPGSHNVPAPPGPVTVVVQNKVALGASALAEDTTPAYLSSRPVPYCAREGCRIPGTEMASGAVVAVDCHVTGDWMANYNVDSSEVRTNPNKASSTLWYHVVMPSGTSGYLSEVYIESRYRGGLGLPACPIATQVSSPQPPSP